jgi:hypothetical protein
MTGLAGGQNHPLSTATALDRIPATALADVRDRLVRMTELISGTIEMGGESR